MTTSDYLEQLVQDKETLKTNLEEKGVEVLDSDTFTELSAKVADIPQEDISEYYSPFNYNKSSTSYYVGVWFYTIKKLYIPENTRIINGNSLFRGFQGEEIINVENIKVENNQISGQFMDCTNIKKLDLSGWNFGNTKPTNISNMFWKCENLEEVDISTWDTSAVKDFSQLFYNCKKLTTIDISNFDFTGLLGNSSSSTYNLFNGCSNLENLTFGINFGKGFTSSTTDYNGTLTLSSCTKLTHDSLMSVINNLYDISSLGITVHLTIGATNIAKLSSAEIQIATDKGWTVN